MVISEKKTRVAQYGQWDHYPSGQGATVLSFLRGADLAEFKKKVNKLKWITKAQAKKIEADKNWTENYPYLSRDAGAEVLNAVMYGKMPVRVGYGDKQEKEVSVIGLSDSSEFAADSLFCEWAYVIDLDKRTLEVYKGFNSEPLSETERFQYLSKKSEGGYQPVRMVKSYSLDELPDEGTFVSECSPKEEVEEED